MFSSLGLAVLVFFLIGTAIVLTLALRMLGSRRSDGTIAQVLYDVEHPEQSGERTSGRL